MAFDTHLVAIELCKDKHFICSEFIGQINTIKLKSDGLLHDVSDKTTGYLDYACALSVKDFPKFMLEKENPWHQETQKWFF